MTKTVIRTIWVILQVLKGFALVLTGFALAMGGALHRDYTQLGVGLIIISLATIDRIYEKL